MFCLTCGKTVKTQPVVVSFSMKQEEFDCTVVVKDVPAEKCAECGDTFFDSETTRILANLTETACRENPGRKKLTVQYPSSGKSPERISVNIPLPDYPAPINRLLTYGEVKTSHSEEDWPNYVLENNFTSGHIPELIRAVMDDVWDSLPSEHPAVYTPVHAWRTLAQLEAVEALEPLIEFMNRNRENDWLPEEIPTVSRMMGPSVIPILQTALENSNFHENTRINVVDCLRLMGIYYPETCQQCSYIMIKQLQKCESDATGLNGFLIAALIELEAKESADAIRQAYEKQVVDETVCGDLEESLVCLGVLEPSPEYLEKKRQEKFELETLYSRSQAMSEKIGHLQAQKLKANKKKMIKQARKKNRRKK